MQNKKIIFFHTGRGGRYYNAGHTTFNGVKNIEEVLAMNDSGKRHSFLVRENEYKVANLLSERDLTNLMELFEICRDKDDFTEFEKKTGLKLGDNVYVDCNGNEIITEAEVESGVGTLDWDGAYDTDVCMYLSDCNEGDLKIIADSNDYIKEDLLQEYFNECTELKIDWSKFNGDYESLITDYFNMPIYNIEDYYLVEECE